MEFIDQSWYHAAAAVNNNGVKWNIKRKLMHNVAALTQIVAFMSLGKMSSIRWRWRWHSMPNPVGSQSVDYTSTKNQLDLVINLRPILNRFVFLRFNFYVWQVIGDGESAASCVWPTSPDHARSSTTGAQMQILHRLFSLIDRQNGAENLLDVYITERNR